MGQQMDLFVVEGGRQTEIEASNRRAEAYLKAWHDPRVVNVRHTLDNHLTHIKLLQELMLKTEDGKKKDELTKRFMDGLEKSGELLQRYERIKWAVWHELINS